MHTGCDQAPMPFYYGHLFSRGEGDGARDPVDRVVNAVPFTFTPRGVEFIYSRGERICQGLPPDHPGGQPHTS